jgi:hypothetical protein
MPRVHNTERSRQAAPYSVTPHQAKDTKIAKYLEVQNPLFSLVQSFAPFAFLA